MSREAKCLYDVKTNKFHRSSVVPMSAFWMVYICRRVLLQPFAVQKGLLIYVMRRIQRREIRHFSERHGPLRRRRHGAESISRSGGESIGSLRGEDMGRIGEGMGRHGGEGMGRVGGDSMGGLSRSMSILSGRPSQTDQFYESV
ncbi:hypothetical protein Tco_1075990 [Tanacetum coccineum]